MDASTLIPFLALATFILAFGWFALSYHRAQKADDNNVQSKLNDPSQHR